MFSREELLILYSDVKDERLKYKLSKILFVDEKFVEAIKTKFKNKDLVKIDKSDSSNEYYIHFISKESDECNINYIKESLYLAKEYEIDYDLRPKVHTLEHPSIEDIWSPCEIEVYAREDLKKYRESK